jgi:hypothetical protein
MHCGFPAKKTHVGFWIIVEKVPENLVEILDGWTVREPHGIHVRETDRTPLIAQIGNVDRHGVRFYMSLMIA